MLCVLFLLLRLLLFLLLVLGSWFCGRVIVLVICYVLLFSIRRSCSCCLFLFLFLVLFFAPVIDMLMLRSYCSLFGFGVLVRVLVPGSRVVSCSLFFLGLVLLPSVIVKNCCYCYVLLLNVRCSCSC